MSVGRPELVRALLRHAGRVMPAARAEWGRAMLAEADHVAADEQLSFAWGCVWSSYAERSRDPATLVAAGRWAIGIGLTLATAVTLRMAAMLWGHSAATSILLLGLICLAATAAYLAWGLTRLPAIAVAGFAAVLVTMVALAGPGTWTAPGAAPSVFFRAILIEQAGGWTALLCLAHLLLALDAKRGASE